MSEVIAPVAPAAPQPAPSAPAPAEGVQPAQNTAEQAPATAPEGEQPETGQDPEKRGKTRYERRLNAAHRRAAEAAARADFIEKQYNELKAKAAPAESDPSAPRLEQFKDIEDYATAKAKHAEDKALKDFQAKQQGETQKQAQARLAETWEAMSERGEGKYDDFSETVGEIKPTTPWATALMAVDNGDEVGYHLGKNMKEARRIAQLSPLHQVLEIGRLSAKLAAEPPKPKTPSKAPAPITPVTGTAPATSASLDDPKMSDKEWNARRSKQVHAAKRR